MDRITEYEDIKLFIEQLTTNPDSRAFNQSLKTLRAELVAELEPENDNAISGINTIPDETLRKYLDISKEIRAFWFDNVDTHILTIERLADQILCRRRAYERRTKDTTTSTPKGVVTKTTVTKSSDVFADIAKLTPEQLKELAAGIAKLK